MLVGLLGPLEALLLFFRLTLKQLGHEEEVAEELFGEVDLVTSMPADRAERAVKFKSDLIPPCKSLVERVNDTVCVKCVHL